MIRAQMAKEAGVDPSQIDEMAVHKRMDEIYILDEIDAKRVHPEDFRSKRTGNRRHASP